MLTDPAPHNSDLAGFRESDRMTTLDLPENVLVGPTARSSSQPKPDLRKYARSRW